MTMSLFLVGSIWYSGDQGDLPNACEMPSYCFATLEEAKVKYQELAKFDSVWSFGFQEAYIIKATPGRPLEAIKGRLRV